MRGFGAVQLDPVGAESGHFGDAAIVGIDQQHAGFDPTAGLRDQLGDLLDAGMAGRAGEMDEADHVGAGRDRGIEDFRRLDPAYLDDQGVGHLGVGL